MTTVLIVEDRPEIAGLWMRFMRDIEEVEFLTAETLVDARMMMLKIPPPDIVLLDLNLPDSQEKMTLEAIKEFKEANPLCLVIVITGVPDETLRSLAFQFGADAFARKEKISTQRDLWSAIKEAIERPHENGQPIYERNLSMLERLNDLMCASIEPNSNQINSAVQG